MTESGDLPSRTFPKRARYVATIKRQQRNEVEEEEEKIERRDHPEELHDLEIRRRLCRGHVSADSSNAHNADWAIGIAFFATECRLPYADELRRDRNQGLRRPN